MTEFKRYLVTAALPYANGPIHLGHVAGVYLPADIYVRYLRQKGVDVVFVSGSDEHGVPITVRAKQEGCRPQDIVDKYHHINKQALEAIQISHDIFARTSSPCHHHVSSSFFERLDKKNILQIHQTEQYFDPLYHQFISDRYIQGQCPHCQQKAYGDQCESCGMSLSPQELLDPISVLSGQSPVLKPTKHWFLPLDRYEAWLRDWLINDLCNLKSNVYNQCKGWLDQGLKPRAITRDLDWGVPVPSAQGAGKVLYVWFDAPIGYISATRLWAEENHRDWELFWKDPSTCLVHFLGKDNIVFHGVIFPVMLKAHGEFILPTHIIANEFLNLEGEKFSTSRDHAVWLNEFIQDFPGKEDVLRYVLCSIMPEAKDSDFTWRLFQMKNNNELVANLGNLVHRTLTLVHKYFNGKVPCCMGYMDEMLQQALQGAFLQVGHAIERFQFKEALQSCMSYAALGNRYLTQHKPWNLVKYDIKQAGHVLYCSLQLLATLTLVLRPFLPGTSAKMAKMLALPEDLAWGVEDGCHLLKPGDTLGEPILLFDKITDDMIQKQRDKLMNKS